MMNQAARCAVAVNRLARIKIRKAKMNKEQSIKCFVYFERRTCGEGKTVCEGPLVRDAP